MSTTATTQTHRASFLDAVRAELAKAFSVRSTVWTFLALVVVCVGFGAIAAGDPGGEDDLVAVPLFGVIFAQIAAVVFGVLTISTEYTQGGMRTTLVAVPRRAVVLLSKAVVVFGLCFAVGLVACLIAFVLGASIVPADSGEVSLGDPGSYRAIVGGALYLAFTGLFGLGLGTILRGSAGAITGALVLLLVAPPLLAGLSELFEKYFTINAGAQIITTVPDDDLLGPWAGLTVFAAEALALVLIGFALLRSRDAA